MQHSLRFGLVLVLLITVQTSWLADLAPFGVPGDLMLLFTIAMGMIAGPVRGAVAGFVAGLTLDLFVLTPLGLTAFTYMVVGYGVGTVLHTILRNAVWIPPVAAFLATVAGISLYVIVGRLLGQEFRLPNLPVVMVVTATMNTLLITPTLFLARWIDNAAPDRMMASHR